MKIIILGAPGSGKGTQARLLAKKLKLKHIVASDLIKKEISKKNENARLINLYLKQGKLIPDKIVDSIIKENIQKNNFILDGYPRTIEQAEFLNKLNKPDKIILLDTPDKILKERLLKRAKIENRIDDKLSIIKIRLEVYKKEIKPLLDYYKKNLIKINGDNHQESIKNQILKALK